MTQAEDDFLVTANDLVGKNFCLLGAKAWCEAYGIDAREAMKNGIMASRLLETGDALAERVVNLIREERNGKS